MLVSPVLQSKNVLVLERFLGRRSCVQVQLWPRFLSGRQIKSEENRDSFKSISSHLFKAEERFWVNYIHDDGSYLKPLRSRLSSRASSIVSTQGRTRNTSTQSDGYSESSGRTRNYSSGSTGDQASFMMKKTVS